MSVENELETYNEITCITAGELRAMGAKIPETIPDCAWTERFNVSFENGESKIVGDTMYITMNVVFKKPMKWVEVKIDLNEFDKLPRC